MEYMINGGISTTINAVAIKNSGCAIEYNVDVIRVLIKAGAILNLRNKKGVTALEHAVLSGEIGVLKVLLAAGAGLCRGGRTLVSGQRGIPMATQHFTWPQVRIT